MFRIIGSWGNSGWKKLSLPKKRFVVFLRKFAVSSEPHVFFDIYSPLKTDHRYPLSLETEELGKSALELDMLDFWIDFTWENL